MHWARTGHCTTRMASILRWHECRAYMNSSLPQWAGTICPLVKCLDMCCGKHHDACCRLPALSAPYSEPPRASHSRSAAPESEEDSSDVALTSRLLNPHVHVVSRRDQNFRGSQTARGGETARDWVPIGPAFVPPMDTSRVCTAQQVNYAGMYLSGLVTVLCTCHS